MSKERSEKFKVQGISFTHDLLEFAVKQARRSSRTLSGYIRSLLHRERQNLEGE